jgi:hypothetical protein
MPTLSKRFFRIPHAGNVAHYWHSLTKDVRLEDDINQEYTNSKVSFKAKEIRIYWLSPIAATLTVLSSPTNVDLCSSADIFFPHRSFVVDMLHFRCVVHAQIYTGPA